MVWMICFYRLPQQATLKKINQHVANNLLWSLLVPHLTDKGLESLTRYLGEEKMQSIGKPFDPIMNELLHI